MEIEVASWSGLWPRLTFAVYSIIEYLLKTIVRASDKRIVGDDEYSDSEDEGDDRKHRESFKHRKKLKPDEPKKEDKTTG